MGDGWDRFNDQFRETDEERSDRQKARRQRLRAEGKCWQCGRPLEACDCPNMPHNAVPRTLATKSDERGSGE